MLSVEVSPYGSWMFLIINVYIYTYIYICLIAYFSSTYVSWCVCLEFCWHYVNVFNLFCWFEPLFCPYMHSYTICLWFSTCDIGAMPSASRHFDLRSFQQSLVTRGHQSGFSSWSCCALLEVKLFWILCAIYYVTHISEMVTSLGLSDLKAS